MLSDQQISQFHRDGLLALRGVFDRGEVLALQRAADEVTAEAVASGGVGHGYREVDGHRQYYRTDGVLWKRDAAFRIATVNPLLLSAVGQCLGHPFMPINDSLVVKLPKSGVAIPWHQDPPYEGAGGLPDTFEVPNFDCDIYLDEATIENGCLYGLAGYHLAGHVQVERYAEEDLFRRPDAVALPMQAGDVLLHAISAPHGSRANDSGAIRRVFYVHFMARETLEVLHPEWIGSKPSFGEREIELVRSMIQERARAGLAEPGTEKVDLTPEGLVFTGDPVTPPRHWETLITRMSSERRGAAKTLA
jgi:ectoine hydroxylase-related dioxygenase (phytanoyl-CoA dioxygenase family)